MFFLFSVQPYLTGSGVFSSAEYRSGDQYCTEVLFQGRSLHPDLPNHVFVTPDLTLFSELNPLHSVTMFSTKYSSGGFTACAVITGRKGQPYPSNIKFNWVVAQDGVVKADQGAMDIGVVQMPTWSTGSRCASIPVKHVSLCW